MTIYVESKYLINIHDKIIEISGGSIGIRDPNLLESSIEHIQNDDYYPDIESKLTHLVYSLIMNHSFIDGNKRTSIGVGSFFLEINGYGNLVGTFIVEMENIVLWVAQKKINKDFLLKVIKSLLEKGELSEEIKIQIIDRLREKN